MNRSRNLNALLVEIMIAVFFFALSATVILETFVAARQHSANSGTDTAAVVHMQDISERLYAADDPAALLAEAGFTPEQADAWTLDCGAYSLEVRTAGEKTDAGALFTADISALRGETVIARLPCARYLPGEVAP